MMLHTAQVITVLLVLVAGEDLHDFLGLNVPFFNKDSGKCQFNGFDEAMQMV